MFQVLLATLQLASAGSTAAGLVLPDDLPRPNAGRPVRSSWADPGIAEEGKRVRVRVVDDQGAPVPTATVRIDDEGLRHRVHRRSAQWTGRATYPDDRLPERFTEGRELRLTVAAPGYLPRTVRYRIVPTKNRVEIPVEPLEGAFATDPGPREGRGHLASAPTFDVASLLAAARPACAPGSEGSPFVPAIDRAPGLAFDPGTLSRLTDLQDADPWLTASFSAMLLSQGETHLDAALEWADIAQAEAHTTTGDDYVALIHDLYRVRALAHHLRWQQWELTDLTEPTRRSRAESERARATAASVATEWVQWAEAAGQGTDLPAALCMAASDRPLDCTP